MPTGTMSQISARNHRNGTVSDIQRGTAMSVVTVSENGQQIVSAITNQAVEEPGLKKNDSVVAFLKAKEAMLFNGDVGTTKVSGQVSEINKGWAPPWVV